MNASHAKRKFSETLKSQQVIGEGRKMKKKLPHKEKSSAESLVQTFHTVLPSHTNAIGTIFGGVLMSWIDVAAAICAQRHAEKVAVTASVDTLNFLAPARLGDTVSLKARVVYTGKTSMVIAVDVDAENPMKGKRWRCVSAFLTFVALDSNNKPTRLPALKITSKKERADFEAAAERRAFLLRQLKSSN